MISEELKIEIEKIVISLGYELYDIVFLKENQSDILRVTIVDKKGYITLDACQKVSEVISPLIDVELNHFEKYFLEVSSPGIERILKSPKHFALSIGQKVQVKLDSKEEFEGVLVDFSDDIASFQTKEGKKAFELSKLKKVKTVLEW